MPLKYPKEKINNLIAQLKSKCISYEVQELKNFSDKVAELKLEDREWKDVITDKSLFCIDDTILNLNYSLKELIKLRFTEDEIGSREKFLQLQKVQKYGATICKIINRHKYDRKNGSPLKHYPGVASQIMCLDCPDIDVAINESFYFSDIKFLSEIAKHYFGFLAELEAKYKAEEKKIRKKLTI